MMYSLTIFKNAFDNKTHRTVSHDSWEDFVQMLLNLSKKKGEKGGNNSSPLISPARYVETSTRSNKNVTHWGSWAAVDVDDFDAFNIVPSVDLKPTLQNICGQYQFVCYSTASSTPIVPKFRLVFPLTREITAEEIPHFWFALNKQLKDIGDKQTKDLSRMYYVPAEYPDAFNFFFTNEGRHLNPDDLMGAWEYQTAKSKSFLDRLPAALREQVVSYRKEQSQNTDVQWTSYRDCPFFPKRLAQEYMAISGTGWYSKMYNIMVATAGNAIKAEYPISAKEIADMCRELDNDTGKWYDNRPLEVEANGAIEFIYRN